jgi:stage V sporulation protein AC
MDKQQNQKYKEYVDRVSPKTKNFPSLFCAFIVGGIICCFGQLINDAVKYFYPHLYQIEINAWMLIIIIFITILLTGIGVWDRVGKLGGAGAFIPITGFANAVASPAIEFKKEGIIYGLSVKMFVVAGPIIVNGVTVSVVIGILHYFFGG